MKKTNYTKELKGQEMLDYIMKTWNMTEDQALKLLSEKLGNRNHKSNNDK